MKKILGIACAMTALTVTSHAALINYTFDEANPLAAYKENTTGITVSQIAYLQGVKSDAAKAAGVAYPTNAPTDNMFAVCSTDLGAAITNYTSDASRLTFDVAVNAGGAMDFSSASLSVDLAAINGSGLASRTNLRLAYNINDAGWVTGAQRSVETTNVTSIPMNAVLFDASTDALLGGYVLAPEALVHKANVTWSLSELGSFSPGDVVQFAILMYDSRDHQHFYTGVDNIKIDGLTVIPEPATLGIFIVGSCAALMGRKLFK